MADRLSNQLGPHSPIFMVSHIIYPIFNMRFENENYDIDKIINQISYLNGYEKGNILVFMADERDSIELCRLITEQITNIRAIPVLDNIQHKFESSDQRNIPICIVTYISEMLLCIDGVPIKYVIDAGYQRIKTYHKQTKTEYLKVINRFLYL